MKLSSFLSIIFFLPTFFINSYSINFNSIHNNKNNKNNNRSQSIKKYAYLEKFGENNNIKYINQKVTGFLDLIRYKNIVPTTYLFLTGAWIIKPNFIGLIKESKVIYSLISTLLILSSNMIVNDLFDMKIDRINNPGRPLVSGKIKIREAIIGLGLMLSFVEFINIMILPKNLQNIIHLSVLYTFMYTPIFKKILFIKNISCALMVAYSIFFGGLSVWETNLNPKIGFFYQIIIFVFFGSLYNEILLDIRDYEGDKKNKLNTIPTVFGSVNALDLSKNILLINVYTNLAYLMNLGQLYYGFLFFLLCIPILDDFYKIEYKKINKNSIIQAVNTSSKQLLFILILICLLSIR